MEFKQYTDIHTFYDAAYNVLMRHEAQNLIPLGNLILGREGKDKTDWRDPANWYMATVHDESGVLLTAIMTPPWNIALYATDNKIDAAAIDCLINGIADTPIPGVLAEKNLAQFFTAAYATSKGMHYEISMDQCIYELTEVNPAIPQIGTMRLVEEKDMTFLPFWYEAFYAAETYGATTMRIPEDIEKCRQRISQKSLYTLEIDGVPVTIAGLNKAMRSVIGVGPVYTPPYFRGKGYASSCVAQLSQLALDKGFAKCVLYTDLANPTSNSIYQKIGYKPICDSLQIKFVQ
ncbi:MAG: GNAT family N-acetyltransferase [Firmicutes bacterium]|nr:GNAT family N-acetyltransferase [Bacillota bacterium]